jgi:hypothetical protein
VDSHFSNQTKNCQFDHRILDSNERSSYQTKDPQCERIVSSNWTNRILELNKQDPRTEQTGSLILKKDPGPNEGFMSGSNDSQLKRRIYESDKGSSNQTKDSRFDKRILDLTKGSSIWQKDPRFDKRILNLTKGSSSWQKDPRFDKWILDLKKESSIQTKDCHI